MSQTDPRPAKAHFHYNGDETWMEQGACIGYDPEWWYADTYREPAREARRTAITICRGCPVKTPCLEYAMATEPGFERHGIWGALTPDARRRLGRKAS